MPDFRCRCTDQSGAVRELVRGAPSEEVLLRDLASEGLYPLAVNAADPVKRATEAGPAGGRVYRMKTVRDFTESIALMVDAGLSVRDALEVAQTVFPESAGRRGESRRLVRFLSEKIHTGSSLSDCLGMLGETFPPVYRGLIHIGERVGSLEGVLTRLSEYLQDQKRMKDKISGALTYPLLVLSVAFGGIILVAAVVVPKARELFSQAGGELPASLKGILQSAHFFAGFAVGIVIAAVAFLLTIRAIKLKGGDRAARIDARILQAPIVGRFLTMRSMVQVGFAMETLTENGVSVEDSLAESARAAENAAIRKALLDAREEVIRGEPLSSALLSRKAFPERVGQWVIMGERAGHVEKVFAQLRKFYQAELDKWSARIMNLVEPALIVAVGAILIIVILVFVVPLFSLYGSFLH